MIGTIELYKAIRERLETFFPEVNVQQKDIKNIERPCFYIQYVGKNFQKTAQEFFEDRISFNIIYFSEKCEFLELLQIEEALLKAFKDPLKILDDTKFIFIEKDAISANPNEEDYYINLTIDFVLMQRMSDDEEGYNIEQIGVVVTTPEKDVLPEYIAGDETMSDIEL